MIISGDVGLADKITPLEENIAENSALIAENNNKCIRLALNIVKLQKKHSRLQREFTQLQNSYEWFRHQVVLWLFVLSGYSLISTIVLLILFLR